MGRTVAMSTIDMSVPKNITAPIGDHSVLFSSIIGNTPTEAAAEVRNMGRMRRSACLESSVAYGESLLASQFFGIVEHDDAVAHKDSHETHYAEYARQTHVVACYAQTYCCTEYAERHG